MVFSFATFLAKYMCYGIHVAIYKDVGIKRAAGFPAVKNLKERRSSMAILKDKKAIIIGDRDGIPGQAISECAVSAGAEVVFSSTECFV